MSISSPTPHNTPLYRADIDGLRAIAVLAVVTYHAFPDFFRGGFIGVDIFFVISGFLISTIIFNDIGKKKFSFANFYLRRIRRIFPAFIIVLFACLLFGWFVLTGEEYTQLGKHAIAGAGFISNLVYWSEAGYFDNAADTKPLLHLWSLGVEEQFYILWPLMLWIAWKIKFNFLALILLVASSSFILGIYVVNKDLVSAFYSPQTRFWELLAGAVLAWLFYESGKNNIFDSMGFLNKKNPALLKSFIITVTEFADALSFFGLILLFSGFWGISHHLKFPGVWALMPVLGCLAIIAAGPNAWVNHKILSNKAIVFIGLISFPLYLWHWPLLSFARIISGAAPSTSVKLLIVALSILLSWLTYKLIERPVRYSNYSRAISIILVICLLTLGIFGYSVYEKNGFLYREIAQNNLVFSEQSKWPYWDDKACGSKFGASPCQAIGSKYDVMLIGDSHANHLYPGLMKLMGENTGILAIGTCSQLIAVSYKSSKQPNNCPIDEPIKRNLEILRANPSIKTVIWSEMWDSYLLGYVVEQKNRIEYGEFSTFSALPDEERLPASELVYRGASRTISAIMSTGEKRVVLVRSTPSFENPVKDICWKRFSSSASDGCIYDKDSLMDRRKAEDKVFSRLQATFPDLIIFDPLDALCDSKDCFLTLQGRPLYRDSHQLSAFGSELVAKELSKKILVPN